MSEVDREIEILSMNLASVFSCFLGELDHFNVDKMKKAVTGYLEHRHDEEGAAEEF